MSDPGTFEAFYRSGTPPWDTGRPQPEIIRLAEEGEVVGDVIDVGCGTGENALFLAARGHRVLGVDASAAAIDRAREKARARGLAAQFQIADALDLGRIRRRCETAIDCGLFHTFTDEERLRYRDSVQEILAPGSTLHLLCFSEREPPGPGPRRVEEYDLRSAFRGVLALTRIREATFESLAHPGGAKAWLATLTRI